LEISYMPFSLILLGVALRFVCVCGVCVCVCS